MTSRSVEAAVGEVVWVCRSAFESAARSGWRSYDPHDLLLAPIGAGLQRRSSVSARILVQLGMRSGPTLRRVLGVSPHEESKALADFLLASTLLTFPVGADWASVYRQPLGARLGRLSIAMRNGRGWGLSFPYASRFVSVPAHTPNAYTTICCVAALARAAEGGVHALLELAVAGARAVTEDIGIVRRGERTWFRYWPGVDTCIVNLQALIAAAFQELGVFVDDDGLIAHARDAAALAIGAQHADGSFPYALDERGQFVDAFHTGFVLEGLTRFQLSGGVVDGIDESVSRGFRYLRARLMDASHLPLARPGGKVVRDGQNIGQLVQTLAICGDGQDRALALDLWRHLGPGLVGTAHSDVGRRGPGRRSLRWDVGPIIVAAAHLAALVCGEA